MTQYQNGTDRAVFELSQAEIDRAIARGRRMRSEAAGDVFAAIGTGISGLVSWLAKTPHHVLPRRPVPRVPGRGFGY